MNRPSEEPVIRVGLLERQSSIQMTLPHGFQTSAGRRVAAGNYVFARSGNHVRGSGPEELLEPALDLTPDASATPFRVASRVGGQFHWSEAEELSFAGGLSIEPDGDGLRLINEVALETYLGAVVSSEMAATCPDDLIRAHSVIARSWLLAQRAAPSQSAKPWSENDAGLRWYDQSAHAGFDVCAEDHCQRYHGVGRIATQSVLDAVAATRGLVLEYKGLVCDARYGKSCGGIVEDARVAWSDDEVPYLVPLYDGDSAGPQDVSSEEDLRRFIEQPPDAFCNCSDARVLDAILPERDRRTTPDFFRWQERIDADELRARVSASLGRDLGPITALVPLSRGRSGRLWQLRIEGQADAAVVGKELEIRRVLSRSHLKSSAFVVDVEGPSARPTAFVLRGAGWGHGAGLCQIGAAVMALRGYGFERILAHYYPATALVRLY